MLLDLYHTSGRRQDFRRLAEEFHLHCNVQAPLWEDFRVERIRRRRTRDLSAHPATGGEPLAPAGLPRVPRASPLRQPRRAADGFPACRVRRNPVAAASPRRTAGRRHRFGSRQRRQARADTAACGRARARRSRAGAAPSRVRAGVRGRAQRRRSDRSSSNRPRRSRARAREEADRRAGRLAPRRVIRRARPFRAARRDAPSPQPSDRASP